MIFSIFVSIIWSCINEFVFFLVRIKFLKPSPLGVKTISVGNVQVGGAGKTPLVAQIAREFVAQTLESRKSHSLVCILSRGYGGTWEQSGGLILPKKPDGHSSELEYEAKSSGDEPVLLHELVPEALIAVGADRVKQFKKAQDWAKSNAHSIDLVILDDGLQHWKIAREIDVIAVTGDRWGQNLFRNFYGVISRSLAPMRLIVWTKGKVPPQALAPDVEVHFDLSQIPELNNGLKNQNFWLVSGVAATKQVKEQLESMGVQIERHFGFVDHARYERVEVLQLLEDAERNDRLILITGKDWVKWKKWLGPTEQARCIRIEPQVKILKGHEAWRKVLWGA